ncbi:MAG: polymer-forming cytoskeletal protein [Lentimicrobiaceae bacterium]|nr:polymer-forming cytoskeletal protein [Lentimicrobiaceae bacterium]
MAKSTELESPSINIIGYGTEIQGNVNTTGDIRVDGKITGDFSTNQKLVIGQSGIIEGDITCRDCDVSGKIAGNVVVNEVIVLNSTADITGDISTRTLAIEMGAQFSGVCKMHRTE